MSTAINEIQLTFHCHDSNSKNNEPMKCTCNWEPHKSRDTHHTWHVMHYPGHVTSLQYKPGHSSPHGNAVQPNKTLFPEFCRSDIILLSHNIFSCPVIGSWQTSCVSIGYQSCHVVTILTAWKCDRFRMTVRRIVLWAFHISFNL